MENRKIFGLTGLNASGKSTLGKHLENKGFAFISLSDFLRKELDNKNIEKTRDNLINIGNELRNKHGSGVLGLKAREYINSLDNNFVIDSIRNPSEILELQKLENFKLIFVKSDPKVRYDRAIKRNRNENFSTFEEFLAKEKLEMSDNKNSQQLHKCIEMANITIENNETIDKFIEKIDELIEN
ncbi:MAG: AAA family ATPase [Nanoarchaeota archaeon]